MRVQFNRQTVDLSVAYEQLAALYEVTHAITAHLQLDVVLDTIARSTAELLGTDTGVILLLDETGETLRIKGAYGLSDTVVKGTSDKIGESIAGRVVQRGEPIIANNLPNDPRFYNPSAANEGLLACISVPLSIGQKIIGTLDSHSKTNHWAFNESHIQMLDMLASQAAIAIENARLYERLQKARDELEAQVQKRTAELVAANERLQHENDKRNRIEKELAEERNWLRTLIDNLPDYIFIKDTSSRFLLVNKISGETVGTPNPEEFVGKSDFDLFPPELAKQYYMKEQEIIRTGQALINQEESSIDLETGAKRWRLTTKIPFRDEQGRIAGIVGISRDITERKRAEEVLRERNRELVMLNHMGEVLQICRTEEEAYNVMADVVEQLFPGDSGCLYMLVFSQTLMKAVVRWGNPSPHSEDLRAEECWALQHDQVHVMRPSGTESLCPYLKDFPNTSCLCAPISVPGNMLGVLYLRLDQSIFDDPNSAHIFESKQMLITRVAEQCALFLSNLKLQRALRLKAIRDPLTGLYNRRYMEVSLKRETNRITNHNSRLGIIMLDIDHFKRFNDAYGHNAGDFALRELGAFLLSHTRGEDIACRYGGEEFLVIMSGATVETARKRAEELWSGIRELQILYQGKSLSLTISAGVAVLPDHGPGINDVVNAADIALYQAKSEGRDRVIIAPTL